MFGNIVTKRTTKNPSSTVNITGLFFARYLGSSFLSESSITLELIADTNAAFMVVIVVIVIVYCLSLLFDFDAFIFLLSYLLNLLNGKWPQNQRMERKSTRLVGR